MRPSRSRLPRIMLLLVGLLLVGLAVPATAQVPELPIVLPDPAFAAKAIPGAPCVVDNEFEAAHYDLEVGDVRYGDLCKRITFAFGPILVKPGENDALIEPLVIDKPAYDGYITRFRPNLVRALDGEAPPTDIMHLHHATWLAQRSEDDNYGSGPLFAAGEEKTILVVPNGYGQRVSGGDTWLLLYMVHNEIPTPEVVWLTYEVDYIAADDAAAAGLLPAKQIWLDVQSGRIHPDAPSTGSNPVFNVHRGFGDIDPETGRRVCIWPRQNCARHDTYGLVGPHQGRTHDDDGNLYADTIKGNDSMRVSARLEGTLIVAGGHLHPGGIRDEVHLVRNGEERPIMISDALYWDWEDPERIGAPPWSWNFVMTGTPRDWRVRIKEGDRIRINAVVDSDDASWYEGMGIVMAWVATEGTHGEPSVDVFDDDVILDRGLDVTATVPDGPYDAKNGWRPSDCVTDLTGDNGPKRLCLRGGPTHEHLPESGNFSGGCRTEGACRDLTDLDGQETTDIVSVGFTYGNADLGVIDTFGIPVVRKGEPVRLWNVDTVARIWHTYTRCAYPCNGGTDMAYPIPDGGNGSWDDHMDFDSNEIGYGTFFEPASGQIPPPGDKSFEQVIRDGLYSEFTPTETGVFTFFCRIHHNMRGAFKVVD
jgi:hypothetical protein